MKGQPNIQQKRYSDIESTFEGLDDSNSQEFKMTAMKNVFNINQNINICKMVGKQLN